MIGYKLHHFFYPILYLFMKKQTYKICFLDEDGDEIGDIVKAKNVYNAVNKVLKRHHHELSRKDITRVMVYDEQKKTWTGFIPVR